MTIQFRQDLIKMLLQRNYMIYCFVCEYKTEELEQLQELGVTPITYKMSRGGLNPFADLLSMLELKKKILNIAPDIVFSFFAKPVIYGSMAAKLAKIPKIVGMLEGLGYAFTEQPDGLSLKAKLIRLIQVVLYKIALPLLDKIIFLNPDDQQDLITGYNIRVKQVEILGGIGLNLRNYRFSIAPIEPVRFIFIGRLLKDKGIFEYIEASKIVKSKYPNAKFVVIGGLDAHNPRGLKQHELDALIEQAIIEYPGYVSNIEDWIAQSSVFVLPSYREGVPRSTQEAMAIGRPVITTDVPGCRETVEDGVNGFLVPKWYASALAEKMIYFIEHPQQINLMGAESHRMAIEKFDADKVNQKLLSILDI